MNVVHPTTPNGYSIFCDDVRMEANGKQIFIGVYGTDILMPSFPIQLPMLHVVIKYNERPGESTHPVKFVITIPGQEAPVFTAEVPREDLAKAIIPIAPDDDVDDPIITLNLLAGFPGIIFPQAGRIKVRAYRGDDEIRLGTIRVRLHPDIEANQKEEAAN